MENIQLKTVSILHLIVLTMLATGVEFVANALAA